MSGPTPETSEGRKTIESVAQLVEYFSPGAKPREDWRIGTEHEKFPFLKDTLQPVPYFGERSIKSLLEGLQTRLGWTGSFDGENIIGLSDPKGLANISLEPGGQFELSGAPLSSIHQTCVEISEHLSHTKAVADTLGIGFLGLGASPVWTRKQTPVMPKSRYGIMAPYMDKVGSMGRDMMFRTSTVQVNLDFADEADMVKKLRVSLALQPIATAFFSNSPFLEGRPNGFKSFRSHVWTDTDNQRSGMLPFAFDPGMGFERYVDYALDVPMYFVMRQGKFINCAGASFRDFLDGKLPQLPGEKPILKDWADHLTTIFPEVRLKRYLEMRGADAGPAPALCALPALWVGLLYDQNSLDAAWDLVKGWSAEDRQTLRSVVPRQGLAAMLRRQSIKELAGEVLKLARAGLVARGQNEAAHLDFLDEIYTSGKTQADRLLDLYDKEWKRDIKQVFTYAAY